METSATRVGLSHSQVSKCFGPYKSMSTSLRYFGTVLHAAHEERKGGPSKQPARGPLVQFARFVNGELALFGAHTTELEYVAISHVWGKIEWLDVSRVQGDVLTSKQKADFISERLPELLDGSAFWMDTLTVNQRNRMEVLATVQFIPDIFRDAVKTIVVRECDGFYDCCAKEVEGFRTRDEFLRRLSKHAWEHYEHKYEESYLQRLWTLQECLLSHTLQFVLCGPNNPKSVDTKSDDLYNGWSNMEKINDSLYVLALLFLGHQGIVDFMRAYIFGGYVSRKKPPKPTSNEDIYSGLFHMLSVASIRVATMPRDYIFATMPQYPWYHYPSNAENLAFNDIFYDLYLQAYHSQHRFAYRITSSVTDLEACRDPALAWLPSKQQPEPACLGDFIKLLGNQLPKQDPTVENAHLTMKVTAEEISLEDPTHILQIIESAMLFSKRTWGESHKVGELTKWGSFPSPDWKRDETEDASNDADDLGGWLVEDGWVDPFPWDSHFGPKPSVTVLQQSMRISDQFWLSQVHITRNQAQKSEWATFRHLMEGKWTQPVLRTILLIAAMVSCKIGLSAYDWAENHFSPVINHYENVDVLGLLSKNALKSSTVANQPLWSVDRHVTPDYAIDGQLQAHMVVNDKICFIGTDLLLVDPETKAPVGLLPDFLNYFQTPEETSDRISLLYGGLVREIGAEYKLVKIVLLKDIA